MTAVAEYRTEREVISKPDSTVNCHQKCRHYQPNTKLPSNIPHLPTLQYSTEQETAERLLLSTWLLIPRDRLTEYWPVWLGLRPGVFTCVGWKVTLCDLIWQVTLHSSEMEFHEEPYHLT